ncbi:MAG: TetR/AcrR family transcriptional regulator [Burkholderiales bacterium]|nr:TetR/AcrR family transcriptional regulator [Burkholderiales bacterium]
MSDMRASEVIVKKQQKMIRKKGRPLGYDPDEILEIAMNLFWANGYEATSLDDILNATNIAKSSFYHMFGNKQQLFERCLNRYCDRQVALIEESIQQSSTGRDFIEKFLHGLVETVRKSKERYIGCFVTNTLYEFNDRNAAVSKILSNVTTKLNQLLQLAIKKGQSKGVITKNKTSSALANFLMSSIAGIRTMIHAQVEIDQLEEILDSTLAALD